MIISTILRFSCLRLSQLTANANAFHVFIPKIFTNDRNSCNVFGKHLKL